MADDTPPTSHVASAAVGDAMEPAAIAASTVLQQSTVAPSLRYSAQPLVYTGSSFSFSPATFATAQPSSSLEDHKPQKPEAAQGEAFKSWPAPDGVASALAAASQIINASPDKQRSSDVRDGDASHQQSRHASEPQWASFTQAQPPSPSAQSSWAPPNSFGAPRWGPSAQPSDAPRWGTPARSRGPYEPAGAPSSGPRFGSSHRGRPFPPRGRGRGRF